MMDWKKLERIIKGAANHRRLQILNLLKKTPELSVDEIATELKINFKTASEHIRRLSIAELVIKRYENRNVRHKLTKRGSNILTFLRMLE